MPALRIEMLGRFVITYQGETVTTVNTHRLQSLLAYLVLGRGTAQSREHLSFLFWPDSSESQARTNLRQLLHHLRSALPGCDAYLEIGSRSLRWRADADFSSDVGEFEQALSPRAQEAGGKVSLEEAARLYRGDLLPGFYEEWVQSERQQLRAKFMDVLSRLVTHLEKESEFPSAISWAERLLACDPLSEAVFQTLIRLNALNRDRAGVQRVYDQCVATLRRELNIEPGFSTRKLYEEMTRASGSPTEAERVVSSSVSSTLPLVGRQKELDQILQSWRDATAGRVLFVFIAGEPGIGKTRLIEEVMGRVGHEARVAYARCGAAEHNLAYAPVTHWLRSEAIHRGMAALPETDLRELVRVVPELLGDHPGLSPPQPLAETWHRRRFFEIMARAAIESQPVLLAVDDLHWCDPESLEWLEFLIHYDPEAKLLILGAAPVDEVDERHVLRPLLNRLIRDNHAIEVRLAALDKRETAALVQHVARRKFDDESMERIHRDTEGNPLFVVESVLAGSSTPHEEEGGRADALPRGLAVPPKVRAVLTSRMAQLSAAARDAAGFAATIGRAFSLGLLLETSRLGEADLGPLIDELCERRIIRPLGKGLYDFSHDKLREAAYEELGPARRELVHKTVAEALEASAAEDSPAADPQIARHYELAGLPGRAIPHYILAARSSRTRYADKEAVGHLNKALQLLQSMPQTRVRDQQELDVLIPLGAALVATQGYAAAEVGRVYDRGRLLCEFLNAREPYFPVLWGSWVFNVVRANFQTAREFATRFRHLAGDCDNPTLVAAGHFMMGCTLFHIGRPADARQEVAAAVECYDPQRHPFLLHEYGPELGVFCRCYLAHSLWVLGHAERSIETASSALARARELGDPFSMALALDYFAMLYQFIGDSRRARTTAEEAAALCEEYGFTYYKAWPPIITGWAMAESGRAEEGIALIHQGLDSLRQIQSRIREPYYLGLIAQACAAAGQAEQALSYLRDSFTVIEKGGETWVQPEIHRIRGQILQDQGDLRGAELSYEKAYSAAVRHEAVSFALRAAVSLGKLWMDQGKRTQVQKLLRDLRGRFSGQTQFPQLAELVSLLKGRARHDGISK